MSAGFCPSCGSQAADVDFVLQVDAIDDGDVRDRTDDRLCTVSGNAYSVWSRENGAHLWRPNVAYPVRRDAHLGSHEGFALSTITSDQIRNELTQFEVFFAAELAILREVYGEAAVAVRWGIIQDYG